jgi:hypothetical protein
VKTPMPKTQTPIFETTTAEVRSDFAGDFVSWNFLGIWSLGFGI